MGTAENTVHAIDPLVSQGDIDALASIAATQGEVVFRDQRGRGVAGYIGQVSLTDEVWGKTATFTLTRTGVQP